VSFPQKRESSVPRLRYERVLFAAGQAALDSRFRGNDKILRAMQQRPLHSQ
jgi:hypothetical protein